MRQRLVGIARRADARVFVVAGSRFRNAARSLRLRDGIHLVDTPRSANILLIVGDLDEGILPPAAVAHDALAPPRASVLWPLGTDPSQRLAAFPDAIVVDATDPVPDLKRVQDDLLVGERQSEAPLLPDVEPATWRGVGPYGQGGKSMTGGVPYGRPMAERAEDRDGLKLDYLPVRIGPLFAPFPVGLALDVKLHGDVIQEATLENFADVASGATSPFRRALREPVAVRELELARARSHLSWLSDAVAVIGSRSFSRRILQLAEHVGPGDGDVVREFERTLRRRGFLGWSTRGIGVLDQRMLEEVTGPVRRAGGSPADERIEEETYRRLGFEPVAQDAGDAAARWTQRIREAAQALDLAERAGDAAVGPSLAIESPRGSVTTSEDPGLSLANLLPHAVVGMEWGDAVTTIVSLDLDMAEAHQLGSTSVAS